MQGNPASPGMYKSIYIYIINLVNNGKNYLYLPTGAGFLIPSTVGPISTFEANPSVHVYSYIVAVHL